MARFSVENVELKGLASAIPSNKVANRDLDILDEKEKALLIKTTGIDDRREASQGTNASGICAEAAQKLLSEINWNPEEIDILVFVSQTPDYQVPGNATLLQQELRLPKTAMCLDINQGCAGYVYGLATISSMMSAGKLQRGMLLVGDVITHTIDKKDKSSRPIFSDAGSATALQYNEAADQIQFNLQADGEGHEAIRIQDGKFSMQGLDVFNFGLREVSPNVNELLGTEDMESIDYFLMHQANKLLNEQIRKKTGFPAEKVPYSLEKFGNTSCATIPVTMVSEIRDALQTKELTLLLSGFGVGLSWGSALIKTEKLVVPEMIEIEG